MAPQEKGPQSTPTNAEIIRSVGIRIGIQKDVMDDTKEQAEKAAAIHIRTGIEKILHVFTENKLPLPPCQRIHQSEDPNYYIWHSVYWSLENNNLVRTMREGDKEATIVAENRPGDWVEYESRILEKCSKLANNKF